MQEGTLGPRRLEFGGDLPPDVLPGEALAKVPAEHSTAVPANVPLHRDIAAAAKEHGL